MLRCMWVYAQLKAPDGALVNLGPGDIIGRMPTAALRLNDPRVSEAHALVSLRGTSLRLLALRGRFFVDNVAQTDVELRPGLRLLLAHHLPLEVVSLSLPTKVLGIEGPGLARQVLPSVAALRADDAELIPSFTPDADAMFWFDGHDHRMRLPGARQDWSEPDIVLQPGATITIGTREFHIVAISLERAASPTTERDDVLDSPLVITLRYETVHVQRGRDHMTIDGVPAMILCELGLIGAPVEWRVVAREIWPNEDNDTALRQRWDRGLARLRLRLTEVGLRSDLVRLLGGGRTELYLHPGDRVEDAT